MCSSLYHIVMPESKCRATHNNSSNTIINGMCNTKDNDAYTSGKPVNKITMANISHTWLASQTGANAFETVSSSAVFPSNISMIPAPKSAPPNNVYNIKEAPKINI